MQLRLEVTAGPGRRRTVVVEQDQGLRVGRTEQADLAFPEDQMQSRLHFAVECDREACRLLDLASTNGTYLNGQKVGISSPLRDGDEIRAGRTTFRVHIDEPSASSAMPASTTARAAAGPPPSPGDDRRGSEPVGHAAPPEVQASSLSTRPEPPHVRPSPTAGAHPRGAVKPGESPKAGSGLSRGSAPQGISPNRYVTGTMIWEDLEGVPRMTVIVKVTCTMPFDGPAPIAEDQLPIFTADVPGGEDPTGPVRFESDMVPFKPKADVVLVGKAHSPRNKSPDAPLDVILRVGRLEKRIRVFGDRTWRFPTRFALIPEFSAPEPFTTMDLDYERAFGGIDPVAARYCAENLAGRGFIGKWSPASIDGKPLPNLEDPSDLIQSWDSRPRPVGFGFYGRGWMPRLKLAGTPHDPPDDRERMRGLPADFSYAFFNGAHPDLQVDGYLGGDEEVELTNLSPAPFLEFRLLGLRPRVTVTKWATSPADWIERQLEQGRLVTIRDVPTNEERIRTALDTLVLIPEEKMLYMVFRGNCKLASLESVEVAGVSVVLEGGVANAKGAREDRSGRVR